MFWEMNVSVYAWMILKIKGTWVKNREILFCLYIFFFEKEKESACVCAGKVDPSCWQEYLYFCTLGAHVWPKTQELIYRCENDILITLLFTRITKVGKKKYMFFNYKRKVHIFRLQKREQKSTCILSYPSPAWSFALFASLFPHISLSLCFFLFLS